MARKTAKKSSATKEKCDWKSMCSSSCSCTQSSGCAYGLGALGAAVYYISTATGFWMGVWGVIKALLWPAFLVYEALKFLGM